MKEEKKIGKIVSKIESAILKHETKSTKRTADYRYETAFIDGLNAALNIVEKLNKPHRPKPEKGQ